MLMCVSNFVNAQNNLIGKVFKSKVDIPAEEFDLMTDKIKSTAATHDAIIESGLLFKIVDQKFDKLIVKLVKFKKDTTELAKKYIDNGKYLHFLISSDNFSEKDHRA